MKKLISAATAFAMAASMAGSVVPTVFAADASKTFSVEAFAEAGSKYDKMGSKITVSKEDIAAGDVTIPCAIYLDEATNDMSSLAVQVTVKHADESAAKAVKLKLYDIAKSYFSDVKTYTSADGDEFETDCIVTFAGEVDRSDFIPHGMYVYGSGDSLAAAGTNSAFVGYSWINNNLVAATNKLEYWYIGENSKAHPIGVFDVILPKGAAAGDYTIDYCKYNTDSTGEHDNPTPLIETDGSGRYTVDNGKLKLNSLTISVEGDAPTTQPTTQATTQPTTQPTTQATTQAATTTAKQPEQPVSGDVVFDFGTYESKAGNSKLYVDVTCDSNGNTVSAFDVNFKIDSPLTIKEIGKKSPATGTTVMSNMANLGANFQCTDADGSPILPDKTKAVFQLTVDVPSTTPTGTYKIGFGDKCEVYKSNSSDLYTAGSKGGTIAVTNESGVTDPVTTPVVTDPIVTTTAKQPEQPVSGDVVFDFGTYESKAGNSKLYVDVMCDSNGNTISAFDVNFKVDSPLTIKEIGKKSPATGTTVMSNIANLGANFQCTDADGSPIVPDKSKAVFQLTVDVPSTTPTGTYKIGFGDKCEVYKSNSSDLYKAASKGGTIAVTNESGVTDPVTTPVVTDPIVTTTVKQPEQPVTGDVVFDFGTYESKAGNSKLYVDVMCDSNGNTISAFDVNFKVDSPLTIKEIGKKSPATGTTVMSNIANLGANFQCTDADGSPIVPDKSKAVFQLTLSVPEDCPSGTYKIGFGDKCEVYKSNSSDLYKAASKGGEIVVNNGTTTTCTDPGTTTTTSTTVTTPVVTTTVPETPGTTYKPTWGDANCDGEVNVADVVVLNKWLNNNASYDLTAQGKVNADVFNPQDASGAAVDASKVDLTASDSDAIIKSIVHLITIPAKG